MGNYVAKQAFLPPFPTNIDNTSLMVNLSTKSKNTIPILHVRYPNSKYTIVFSHGNAEDLGGTEDWICELSRSLQIDVVGYDYSGYGFSQTEGGGPIPQPTEAFCYTDIEAVYTYLVDDQKKEPNTIILMGRSLGTGPTCELASKKTIGGVILQSPLLSAVRVVTKTPFTLPIDIFANQDKIRRIKAPIFIVHGVLDQVISIEHGKELHKLIQVPEYAWEPWWIPNAGHNDIEYNFHETYLEKLAIFISALDGIGVRKSKKLETNETKQEGYSEEKPKPVIMEEDR